MQVFFQVQLGDGKVPGCPSLLGVPSQLDTHQEKDWSRPYTQFTCLPPMSEPGLVTGRFEWGAHVERSFFNLICSYSQNEVETGFYTSLVFPFSVQLRTPLNTKCQIQWYLTKVCICNVSTKWVTFNQGMPFGEITYRRHSGLNVLHSLI